ncbi:MAG: elongation factor P [Dehalococcoidia bacterium]|nr:MAG: elongation factor P [Dehalococcoidia bacterium]
MIGVGDLRRGIVIELDGKLYNVLEYQHLKLGRGSAQVRLKLKDIKAGHTIERTFQAGERFTRVRLDRRPVEFLYRDGDTLHFMDRETFEQFEMNVEQLGEAVAYLKEGVQLDLLTHDEVPISVELPFTVDLKVIDTPPGFKGDTATGSGKSATLETGIVVQVPFFINVGDVVRIDTRDGSYIERVSG